MYYFYATGCNPACGWQHNVPSSQFVQQYFANSRMLRILNIRENLMDQQCLHKWGNSGRKIIVDEKEKRDLMKI